MDRLTTVWPTLKDCFDAVHSRPSTAWEEIKTACPDTLFFVHKEQPRTAFEQFGVLVPSAHGGGPSGPLLAVDTHLLSESHWVAQKMLEHPVRGSWHCRSIRCDRISDSLIALRSWLTEGDPIGATIAAVDIRQQADALIRQLEHPTGHPAQDTLTDTFLEVANLLSQIVATKNPTWEPSEADRKFVVSLACSLKHSADELISQVEDEDNDGPQ